jgi:hypothetical protein
MKRIIAMIFMLLVAAFAFGQEEEYYPTTPPTLVWDEAPGTWLPGDVVEYEVYVWDRLNGEIEVQPISSLSLLGTTTVPQMELTFPYRAPWQVGVRLKHTDGGGNLSYSSMIYSSIAEDTLAGVPFSYIPGTVWYPVPDPTGLRDSGMTVP